MGQTYYRPTAQIVSCKSNLMAYRSTPLESGISPAELLMGRKICTRVPTLPTLLCPSWPYLEQFRQKDASLKTRQKTDFDRRHSAKTLPDLPPGEHAWLPDQKAEGTVVDRAGSPRSYVVETPNGQLRRNRRHLNLLPGTLKADAVATSPTSPVVGKTDSPMQTNTLAQTSEPVISRRTT